MLLIGFGDSSSQVLNSKTSSTSYSIFKAIFKIATRLCSNVFVKKQKVKASQAYEALVT